MQLIEARINTERAGTAGLIGIFMNGEAAAMNLAGMRLP